MGETRSTIRIVQVDNVRNLMYIKRRDRMQNFRVGELCREKKGIDEI